MSETNCYATKTASGRLGTSPSIPIPFTRTELLELEEEQERLWRSECEAHCREHAMYQRIMSGRRAAVPESRSLLAQEQQVTVVRPLAISPQQGSDAIFRQYQEQRQQQQHGWSIQMIPVSFLQTDDPQDEGIFEMEL